MAVFFRTFLRISPPHRRLVAVTFAWMGLFSVFVALFMAAVVGFSADTTVLSARSLDERAGIRFPLADSALGVFGRLQAMNVTPVNDSGLALQWHLLGWPNQWFDRFPLTVDQNLNSARGRQTEESVYWLTPGNDSLSKKTESHSACPQVHPNTPSSYRLWDSASVNPGQHLGELLMSDSLADQSHPDLDGVITLSQSFGERKSLLIDNHGTHVAGVVAAQRNGEGVVGVVPGLQIRLFPLDVKHLRQGPRIDGQQVLDNLDAILASLFVGSVSAERLPRVILLSWAFFESDGIPPDFVDALEARMRRLLEFDVAVVVPAGNLESGRMEGSGKVFPAAWASQFRDLRGTLLPVASLDICSNPSWFSNLAANDLGTVLLAPGERIYSSLPENDFGFMSGTSASAAQVAAVLAMTSAQFPDVDMKAQVHTLIRTATPLANRQGDRLVSFEAPALVQGLMAEFGWIARY